MTTTNPAAVAATRPDSELDATASATPGRRFEFVPNALDA